MATYHLPHDPKIVHEAMCMAEGALIRSGNQSSKHYAHIISDLIRECERKRPLASNGKHGNLHTPECGCEDIDVPLDPSLTPELLQEVEMKRCPDCEWREWNPNTGRYVTGRKTRNMVCQTCGRNYLKPFPRPTKLF